MIILSQGKSRAINADRAGCIYAEQHLVNADVDGFTYLLGRYDSEERAKDIVGAIYLGWIDKEKFFVMPKE